MKQFMQTTKNEKGVSLLEMLFAISLILVMAASFHQLLSSFYENYEVQEAIAETQQQGRVTADLFWHEIRNTGFDPTGRLFDPDRANLTKPRKVGCVQDTYPVEPIFEAAPTIFHFLADLNQNGEVDGEEAGDRQADPKEHVRYEWVGDADPRKIGSDPDACGEERTSYTLYRDTGGGMQAVSSHITAFALEYYDEDGVQIAPGAVLTPEERARIRRVVLKLTARTGDPLENGYGERKLRTDIWLRNM